MDAVKGGRGPAPRTLDGRTRQSSTLIAVIEMSQSRSCRRSTYHAVMVATNVALDNQSPIQACPWLEPDHFSQVALDTVIGPKGGLDRRPGPFETVAPRPPQGEDFS